MTKKSIKLNTKKTLETLEKGSIVKKNNDMFIVAKISEAQFNSPVEETLFGSNYNNSHMGRPTYGTTARRNPALPKYVLISLTSGAKYYPEFLTINELLPRMTQAGFEPVSSVEIKEVN